MAKQLTKSGISRVRFIMLEAEGAEGDLVQVAQAIQNALRTSQTASQRVIAANTANSPAPISASPMAEFQQENIVEDAELEEVELQPQKPREPKQRRTTVPKAVEFDADVVSAWKIFASSIDVQSDLDRYLLVAAWLHEHRKNEPVTAGHVYSCYRLMKWSVSIPDFGAHLRAAKSRQFLVSGSGRGEYTITQLGLQRVEDLRKS